MHGVRHLFGHIYGRDSLPRIKLHSDMLHAILKGTMVRAGDALFVGATVTAIEMGRAAGIVTCGAAYGHHGRHRLDDAGAHQIIEAFTEVLSFFG